MFVARKIGRDALSIFLHAMGQQQGHWYATLLPIRDVLCQCGLYSVMPMVWVELIRENELEEVEGFACLHHAQEKNLHMTGIMAKWHKEDTSRGMVKCIE